MNDFSLVSISVVKESLTTAIDGKKYSRKGAKAQREGLNDFSLVLVVGEINQTNLNWRIQSELTEIN